MDSLNDLEISALRCIAEQFPETSSAIFESCSVSKRENTGHGFFTSLTVETGQYPPISYPSPMGDAWVKIDGLQYGICCLVFLTNGFPSLLEGYSVGDEDTSNINFSAVGFSAGTEPPMI